MAILAEQYPGRRVVSVDARPLFERGGGVHCITQQQAGSKSGLSRALPRVTPTRTDSRGFWRINPGSPTRKPPCPRIRSQTFRPTTFHRPRSPFYNEEALSRDVGVRFNGVEKNNVYEYNVAEGWVRVKFPPRRIAADIRWSSSSPARLSRITAREIADPSVLPVLGCPPNRCMRS